MQLDFDAGKYAIYMWPAFGISALAFAWMIGDSLAKARHWKRELQRLQAEGNTGPGAGEPQA